MPKFLKSWATRSLMIGALAGGLDIGIGTFLAVVVHLPTRACTAVGLIIGTTLNFFAQSRFAFRERDNRGAWLRWLIVTTLQIAVHGQLVVLLRDHLGIPYVPAKMAADVCIFTFLQLWLLRYVVFPARAVPAH